MNETGWQTVPSGWHVCPTCKGYIPDGSIHYCPGPQAYQPTYTYGNWFTLDQETKDILKRIADALEKIAEKVTE